MTDKEKIKYKDLVKKMKQYEDNEVVMVASDGEVSFYDKEGMVRIIHLSELEEDESGRCYVVENKDY